MRTEAVGKIIVGAKLENQHDLTSVQAGTLPPDQVRSAEVPAAMVDTGATMLCAPLRIVTQLGLLPARARTARTAAGTATFQIYGPVNLTVQGRECICEVMGLPDDCPVLIGQVPLELLDWIIDPQGQRLIGNPDHGGQQMVDVF